MSERSQERRYILRQPITVDLSQSEENCDLVRFDDLLPVFEFTLGTAMMRHDFEELFVEFDRETLKQQIADELAKLAAYFNQHHDWEETTSKTTFPDGGHFQRKVERSTERVLGLLDPKGDTE